MSSENKRSEKESLEFDPSTLRTLGEGVVST